MGIIVEEDPFENFDREHPAEGGQQVFPSN
jgi:hypothetical protein